MKTTSKAKKKTKPPYPGFPLFLRPSGQWAKKIRQKVYYFGVDPDKALAKYLDQKDDLHAGRTPRAKRGGLDLADLCNRYLTAKKRGVDAGELAPRTHADLYRACQNMLRILGKTRFVDDLIAEDFGTLRAELAKVRGPVSLGNEIQKIRGIFKYAYDDGLIDRPVRFGASFKKPNRKSIRQVRVDRMIEAAELQRILKAAANPIRAMILLGLNCAFGQSDIARLPKAAIDLQAGWINFPRPKTAIARRIPLWKETVAALRDAIKNRPTPRDEQDEPLAFITKYGHAWVRVRIKESGDEVPIDSVRLEYNKVLNRLGLKRAGGFYNLRHVFRTVADGCLDVRATDAIMGHVGETMGDRYVEKIDDARLHKVVDHVHQWLFGKSKTK